MVEGYQMESERVDGSNCCDQCPVSRSAEIIEGKWTTLIIRELMKGKLRYSEIQQALVGISPKILAQRLRFLEQKGLVKKSIYATVPPTTEYELTSLGHKMQDVLFAMATFGEALKNHELNNCQLVEIAS